MKERKITVENLSPDKFNLKKDKCLSKHEDKFTSKGVRLNWTSLNDVKPVVLSDLLTTGKSLNETELSKRSNNSFPNNILIP